MRRYYNLALRLSKLSNHKKHKLGCVLIRGGSILATSYNLASWGRHAEKRVLQHRDAEGATLYIARENHKMSRPCPACMVMIKEAKIAKVVYKDWQGNICVENVNYY